MTIYSAWNDLNFDQRELDNATLVENQLQQITKINEVITELQKERGLTAIYNADPNREYAAVLKEQRHKTTEVLASASNILDLSDLLVKRKLIQQNIDLTTFNMYTQLIFRLMKRSEDLVFNTYDAKIKNSLIIYHLLKNAQENAGQLRAKIGTVLTTKELTIHNHQDIVARNALYHHLIMKSQSHQPLTIRSLLEELQNKACVRKTNLIIHSVIHRELKEIAISPLEWFKLSTCTVNHLHEISNKSLKMIQNDAVQTREKTKNALIRHLFFWIGGVTTLFVLLIISLKHSRALAREHQLLENYQEAIDYSTIVSKADKKGIITYVNRAFCDISGYSAEELLHQPHNIIRHPDMPKEVFKMMWGDIQKGEKWQGVIKNLRKDGTPYWVDASISPIFDDKGELVEYMAIRRDITDMILLNKEIKETQSELIYRMGEAVESRSKESGHHVQRVAHYSKLLAEVAGLSRDECEIIFAASTMHDVGKISIPDAILLKAEALTDEEWSIMKTHAETGYKILEGSERPLLKMAATVAYEHHEHFDGNGYPRGLNGKDISIYGRIVAITDVFDALATDRIYKKAWPLKDIFEHLKEQSGKQFDPELIELVLNHLDQFLEIKNKFQDQ
ncbi:MAG: HD domain-containing phosphohydrolase [Sulfurimonadaceae bacterium]